VVALLPPLVPFHLIAPAGALLKSKLVLQKILNPEVTTVAVPEIVKVSGK
jgi:hypothetical protein